MGDRGINHNGSGGYGLGLFALGPDPTRTNIRTLKSRYSTLKVMRLISWPVGVRRSTVHGPSESSGKFCLRL